MEIKPTGAMLLGGGHHIGHERQSPGAAAAQAAGRGEAAAGGKALVLSAWGPVAAASPLSVQTSWCCPTLN